MSWCLPEPRLAAPPLAALYEQRLALLGWVVVAAALTVALTSMARPIVQALQTCPATRGGSRLLGTGDPVRVLVGYFLFGTLQLLLALYRWCRRAGGRPRTTRGAWSWASARRSPAAGSWPNGRWR